MHPQLQAILDDLSAVRARWQRLSVATPDDRWAVRPDPERWSVAECIAHLNLTARAMQPLLEAAAEEAKARPRLQGDMKPSLFGRMLAAMVGPVPKLLGMRIGRVRTPPPFVPTGDEPRSVISAEFERHLAAHETAIRAAEGLALHEVSIESPFRKGARYDAYSGWLVVVQHLNRHLGQGEEVWKGR